MATEVDDASAEPQSGEPSAEPPAEPAADSVAIEGSLSARYIGRAGDGDQDHDLYTTLGVRVGDQEEDPYSAYVLGRLSQDLDGDSGGEDSPFFSLEDTYDHRLNGKLYEAYFDFQDLGLDLLRVGRQVFYETPAYVRFDGASAETEAEGRGRWRFGAYGGQTSHLYDSSEEDAGVFGAYVSNSLWRGGRTRLDYMHLEDEDQLGSGKDDLWAGQVHQAVAGELYLKSGYTLLESSPREFDARATWLPDDSGWMMQTSYYELLQTEGSLAEELDPYYDTLQELDPYYITRVVVAKSFEQGYTIEGGADSRQMEDSGDEGEFNREYQRYHLTGTIHDLFLEGLALALTGDRWDSDGSDTDSWGLDLTREMSEKLRTSIGTYYQLYKNDFLLDEEQEDVRTYYLALRYRPEKRLTWGFGYEYEDSEEGGFNTVTARATWNF